LRLEMERKAIEKFVADKLNGGCDSFSEILASAWALPP
jgi:hypothetical protein